MAKSNDQEVKLPPDENPHQGVGVKIGKTKQGEEARRRGLDKERERLIETQNEGKTGRERELSRPMTGRVSNLDYSSPFSLMSRLMEDMDQIFWGSAGNGGNRSLLSQGIWEPQIETFRRGDKLVVRADLPGLRKEDVQVDVEGDVLTISGERRDEHEEEHDGYYHSERSYGSFYRAVPLPEDVDPEACNASFKDGVLEVTLHVPPETQRRRRIEVR